MSQRLRVVYLDHCAQLSGSELALLHLLPALADEVEAHVVLAEDGPLVDKLRAAGIRTEILPMAATSRGLARDRVQISRPPVAALLGAARYTTATARRLRGLRPDLVHANSLKSGLYGSVAGRFAGVPVVWHLHEQITAETLPPLAEHLVRASVRHLPSSVIANSASTLHQVATSRLRAIVVPPAVDVADVPAVARPAGVALRIGMVGRLAPLKGQHVFLEAFAQAFPASSHGEVKAILVGAPLFGETAYEERLRGLIRRLGVERQVEMTGFREDIAAELARMDVLVQASVTPEGFGRVVVEGMAAGLPVIATRSGGTQEIVTDGVDGLLCPPNDVAALAGALRRLLDDEHLRRRLGQQGRLRARDFTLAVIAPQVLTHYRAVLRP